MIGPTAARKPFPTRPPPMLVAKFKKHVKEFGTPETFPLIDQTFPSSHEGAEILCSFRVNRARRPDRDMAPCPVCSPCSGKYLEGCLVWYPAEGVIRAIGHDCSGEIDSNWHKRKRAFKEKERQEAREEFLEANLHQVPELVSKLRLEIEVANQHRRIWTDFRKKCPSITQDLRKAMSSGRLTIQRERSKKLNEVVSGPKYIEDLVGYVEGQTAVKSNFTHHTKFREQLSALELIEIGNDFDTVFLAICDMTTQEMSAVEKVIKRSARALSELQRLNQDFRTFFSLDTISKINTWAQNLPIGTRFELLSINNAQRMHVKSDVSFEHFSIEGL